jgi:hypothetical protein
VLTLNGRDLRTLGLVDILKKQTLANTKDPVPWLGLSQSLTQSPVLINSRDCLWRSTVRSLNSSLCSFSSFGVICQQTDKMKGPRVFCFFLTLQYKNGPTYLKKFCIQFAYRLCQQTRSKVRIRVYKTLEKSDMRNRIMFAVEVAITCITVQNCTLISFLHHNLILWMTAPKKRPLHIRKTYLGTQTPHTHYTEWKKKWLKRKEKLPFIL